MEKTKAEEKINKLLNKYKKEENYYKQIILDYELYDRIIISLQKKYAKKIMHIEKKIKEE